MRIWKAGERPVTETTISIDRPLHPKPERGKYLVIGEEPYYITAVSYKGDETVVDIIVRGSPHRYRIKVA